MKRFSQRYNHIEVKDVIQLESMNSDLRTALWNAFYKCFIRQPQLTRHFKLILNSWEFYFKRPLNELPDREYDWEYFFHNFFLKAEWYEVYDLIEFFLGNLENSYEANQYSIEFNLRLENESSGYRIISFCVTPISDIHEIESISTAINRDSKYKAVSAHLDTALVLMSDKKNPDYRNSIKESISAIESLCKIVTENPKATLGSALKLIENNHGLHGSLKQAFEKLYGYTSDGDGIRHAMIEEPNLNYSDAKFMLVVCSAFVNYLKLNYSSKS